MKIHEYQGKQLFQKYGVPVPIGMAAMTGPIKALGEQPPGTYRFEVDNGSVWKKPGNWALTFAAKIQGEAETVRGGIVVRLEP